MQLGILQYMIVSTLSLIPNLDIQIGWNGDVSWLGHLRQGPDAVLDVEPLVEGQPGALGDPERGSQELSKDGLPGLEKRTPWSLYTAIQEPRL